MATTAIDLGSPDLGALDTEPIDSGADVSAEGGDPSSEAAGQPSTEGQQGQSPNGENLDGRRGPANIRNSIKAAAEALPEQAQAFKELGNAYFREQAYKQAFPTPQDATSAKQLIETAGGLEGISKLQEMSQTYEAQDGLLREGNPEVLESFAKDFPEGFAALAGPYLDRLQQSNPQAYAAAIAPHAFSVLESAGIGSFLGNLLQETDAGRIKQSLQQLASWYDQQRNGVQQAKQAPAKNPASDRLQQQQTEIEQQREQIFNERVQDKVNGAVNPEILRTVDLYAKQYKLSDTQKKHFQETLQARVIAEMNADSTYKTQVNMRRTNKARTPDSVSMYIAGEFNRRIKDAAFATAKDVFGAPKGAAAQSTGVVKAGTPKAAPNGGPLLVSQRPPDSQLDLARPGADMLLIQGRGYTKDGRFITWRR